MQTAHSARIMLVAALIIGGAAQASATTYVVSPDGPGDYPTIQAAVDAVVDYDVIELADGTFTGDGNRDIEVPAKNITIRSEGGDPMSCIVDCQGSARAEHRGFHFTRPAAAWRGSRASAS